MAGFVDVDASGRYSARPPLKKTQISELEDFFENGAIALHLVGPDGTILRANKAELELLGYEPHEYIGRPIAEFHADRLTIEDILARLSRGERLDRYPARLRAKDGSLKHVEITSSVHLQGKRFLNTRCFTFDVTAVRRAQELVKEKEIRLQQILDALPAAVYTTDAQGKITYFNPAAEQMAGRTPQLGKDKWCVTWRLRDESGNPLPHDQCPMATALKENRPVRGVRAFAERPDGRLVPFMPFPTPLYDSAGTLSGAINMLIDMTDQNRREAHIEFVMRELSHRSKNLLAIVQAIAFQSLKSSDNLSDFETKFLARIQALARAHDLLIKQEWSGVPIHDVIQKEVDTFDGEQKKHIKVVGEPIVLNATEAQHVALAVHELATNAVKYGALSSDSGRVELTWSSKSGGLRLAWHEFGGKTPASPTKHGFGTQMLEALFREADFQFSAPGFCFSGVLPLHGPAPASNG